MEWGGCGWCSLHTHERSLVPGCWSQSSKPSRVNKDRIWLCKTQGSNFSPLCMWQRERETAIDRGESSDINKLPCGEPEAVLVLEGKVVYLVLLRVHSAWLRGGHTERDTHTLNTNVMLDIQPKASGFASLNSCTGRRENGKFAQHVEVFVDFFHFPFSQQFFLVHFLHCHLSLNVCFGWAPEHLNPKPTVFTGEEILLSEDELKFLSSSKRQKYHYWCS